MKKLNSMRFALMLAALLFSIIGSAQKLPAVQLTSLKAPKNIKIDGKATEWNNQFQAYNKATQVYYTIANDDSKLYLTIQATNRDIIEKISKGGVSFVISPLGSKKSTDGVAVTFPMYDKKDPLIFLMLNNRPEKTKDTVRYKMQTDSFMNVLNTTLNNRLKIIGVTGIKAITDSVISIYNENGIKAAALFDSHINYTYELSIPLKYLSPEIIQSKKFSYNIILNSAARKGTTIQSIERGAVIILMYTAADGTNYVFDSGTAGMAQATPTDFWGEYTLAK